MTSRVGKRAARQREAAVTERSPSGRGSGAGDSVAPESMTNPKDKRRSEASQQDAANHPDTIPAPAWFDEVMD